MGVLKPLTSMSFCLNSILTLTLNSHQTPPHSLPVAARGEIGQEGCKISSLVAGPSPRFSSRGGPKTRWRGKKQKRGLIFKIQYWMYAATEGPNVKWGGHRFQMGGPGTTGPPLATALSGWTYGIVTLAVFIIISGVFSHSSSPNLIKLVIFSCPYWYNENIHFSLMKPNPKA